MSDKAKRKRVSPYRTEQRSTDVAGAIADAFAEFQSLRDEMAEARDNMSAANMEHLPKYEMLETAHDALDAFADNEPTIPDCAEGLAVVWTAQVNRRKGRGESRAVRLANAMSLLDGVVSALEEQIGVLEQTAQDEDSEASRKDSDADEARADAEERKLAGDEDGEADHISDAEGFELEAEGARERASQAESEKDSLEEFKDEIENITSEGDSIEFPGMYG